MLKESKASKKQWEKIKNLIRNEKFSDTMKLWEMVTYLPIEAGTLTAQNRTRIISAGWKIFETPAEDYFLIPAVLETFGLHDDARCFII